MDKNETGNDYRSERKERLAKAAKKRSKKQRNSTDIIAGVIKALVIVVIVGLVCGALYMYGVPQKLIPAMKVGDRTYSAAEYSYYYTSVYQTYANTANSYIQQYGFNLSGFDTSKSPADQTTKDDDGNTITYDELFRNKVAETLESYSYYLSSAKEKGITLTEENAKKVESDIADITSSANTYGYSATRYISILFGKGLTEGKLRSLLSDQYLVQQMVTDQQDELKAGVTDDQITAEYEKDPSEYEAVDIRLLGIKIEDTADSNETASEPEASEPTSEEPTDTPSTEPENAETDADKDNTQDESAAVISNAEKLAKEMYEKVTDEDSFIALCKVYCAEDQKATFEDPSASLAIGIKKSTVSSNIDKELADWLFASDRAVGDKTYTVAKDYAYVIMMKKTAYREESPLVSARHILISYDAVKAELEESENNSENETEDDTAETEAEAKLTASDGKEITGEGSYSAEVVLAAYEKALSVLNEYKDGENTEDHFAELAEKYSNDTGSVGENNNNTSGGLYTDITKGQMVAPFENWVYDSARKPGDVGLVQTNYGWHVMYFVSSHDEPAWKESIRSSITSNLLEEYENGISEQTKDTSAATAFTAYAAKQALKLINDIYVKSQAAAA